jgi:hypothetical protein
MYQKYSDYSPKEVNGDGGWRRPEVRGGRGKRSEDRKETFSVLREEHEKLKIRPSSFVQDRGPVLGKSRRAVSRSRARRSVLSSDASRPGSWFLPATHNAQPIAVLTARKAELARRSGTGLHSRLAGLRR